MEFTQIRGKYAEKCVAMALSSEQDVDKALWLTLAQSWAQLGELVAYLERGGDLWETGQLVLYVAITIGVRPASQPLRHLEASPI
jgi:hypothetical protein